MYKVDCAANRYVASALVCVYAWITNATADCEEDYSVADVVFSSMTDGTLSRHELENKRILGGWQIKYDGEWNSYFTSEIYDKLKFHGLPPEEGTPIYFVNDIKWNKLLDAHACLCFLAPDGMLLFSHKELKEAFLGYADYFVRHTTQFNNKRMQWEKKAVLDLSKASYVPLSPPIELFIK